MRTLCSGSRGISSIVTSRRASGRRTASDVFDPARSEKQCLPQCLLFCRSSNIPGCAMSVPSHLRPDCDSAGRDQPALPLHKVQLGGSDLSSNSLNRVLDGSVGSSLSRWRVLHHDLATSQLSEIVFTQTLNHVPFHAPDCRFLI